MDIFKKEKFREPQTPSPLLVCKNTNPSFSDIQTLSNPSSGINEITFDKDVPSHASSSVSGTREPSTKEFELEAVEQPSFVGKSRQSVMRSAESLEHMLWWDKSLITAMGESEKEANLVLSQDMREVTRSKNKGICRSGEQINRLNKQKKDASISHGLKNSEALKRATVMFHEGTLKTAQGYNYPVPSL